MAYKKMSFLLRACMTFVLFIGLAQACRHDGRPDTLCSMTCPATARPMVRSSSAGSLGSSAQASLVLCASLSPVLSSSALPDLAESL